MSRRLVLALFCLLATPLSALAQYQGENFRGDYGVNSGTQGPPGLYVIIPWAQQSAARIKDASGAVVIPDVFKGFDLRLLMPTVYVVTPRKILGGNYGFTVTLPFTNVLPERTVEESHPSGWGLSDTYVGPFTLGWTAGRADFIAGYAFSAPTGRYEPGTESFGLGMWSHELQGGTTVYLDSEKRISMATTAFLEMHSKKKNEDLRVGDILTLEGGAAYNVEKIGAAFGIGYSLQSKVTDDRGADVPVVALRALNLYGRNKVFSIGPDLTTGVFEHGRTIGQLNVRYLWESAARSSFEGSTLFVGFSIARLAPKP